jgi:phosphopantetheine adenylyltransferase
MSVVALYGGGFKPPTKGHYEVVKQTLEKYPEIDELKIIIGSKERDGVTQDEALRIWDIYNDSLPMKVTLEPSTKPPIRSIYDYAKDNPEDTVYWILGKREGNESDDLDIELRTRSIDKYPNIEVKKIETRVGVSGTQMRNAMSNKDEFLKFVPDEVKDKESVYNVINEAKKKKNLGIDAYALELAKLREKKDPKVGTGKKPKGSSRRLYTDEDPKDTVGVKFSSRQDIVDTFNKKSFKSKSHARQSQIINLVHQRVRAAYNRAKDPKVKKRLKTALEYAKKRKEASKEKTKRMKKLNEGLFTKNYWKSILTENKSASDLAPYILSLTQFMELNGLNLKPYPKVKFIHNDEPNAKDLFGRTAYYDSANNEVYLYTLMRHPKDILRSYAHELIHAHQNNEGRIHDITTTNVNQDEYLTDLEKEAYETGNILFRSWSDNFKE